MMQQHRCGNMIGPCSCGMFHHTQNNSFSMLFSMPNNNNHNQYYHKSSFDETEMYPSYTSSSSSVDCTLSLGTPSTRLTEDVDVVRHERRSVSNFCWDLLQPKNASYNAPPQTHKTNNNRTGGGGGNNNNTNSPSTDPLLARRCANCDTTSTPLWRNGPRGPKSLCNACGIRFKKEERRASAANGNGGGGGNMEQQHVHGYNNNSSWTSQKMPSCYSPAANEYRFIEENDQNSFLSWRLNVTDRASLVHDFTR